VQFVKILKQLLIKKQVSTINLAVDHDHLTGENRGLLCTSCNRGLGCFRDSVKYLDNAKKYISNHNNNQV